MLQIALLVRLGVAQLHRISAALHQQDRRGDHRTVRPRRGEMEGQLVRVQRCRGDDQLEFGPARQQAPQPAEQEVDVEAALVRLVEDDGVVGQQLAVALQLGQQDAVGHQLDQRALRHAPVEARLIADQLAQAGIQLRGDAPRHAARRQAPRLGMADQSAQPPPQLQAQLGQLGGLARAGLAADHHHLVLADRRQQLVPGLHHRQLLRPGDGGGAQAGAVLRRQGGLLEVAAKASDVEPGVAARPIQLPAQALGIAQQQHAAELSESGLDLGKGVQAGTP